jgi:hypothetical protein
VLGYNKNLFVKELSRPVVPWCSILPELCDCSAFFDSVSRSDDAVKAADIRWIELLVIWYIIIVTMLVFVLAAVRVKVLDLLEPAWRAPAERFDPCRQFSNCPFNSMVLKLTNGIFPECGSVPI